MSDSPLGSEGAKCVAAAVTFIEELTDMKLENCEITDAGAVALFTELVECKNISIIELGSNPITEASFDALVNLLDKNRSLKQVNLTGIQVKSKFAWMRLNKFANRVVH